MHSIWRAQTSMQGLLMSPPLATAAPSKHTLKQLKELWWSPGGVGSIWVFEGVFGGVGQWLKYVLGHEQ
jgi:hypothetical protein